MLTDEEIYNMTADELHTYAARMCDEAGDAFITGELEDLFVRYSVSPHLRPALRRQSRDMFEKARKERLALFDENVAKIRAHRIPALGDWRLK